MQTFEEQKEFFERHWPAMKDAVESGGAPAVVRFIEGFTEPRERRVLYMFARQGLSGREWEGKSFDTLIAVCDAGIAEFLRQAGQEEDAEKRLARWNGAHVLSFYLAADLAECWPGDEAPRTEAHFRRGLKAAEDAIAFLMIDGPTAPGEGPGPRPLRHQPAGEGRPDPRG